MVYALNISQFISHILCYEISFLHFFFKTFVRKLQEDLDEDE